MSQKRIFPNSPIFLVACGSIRIISEKYAVKPAPQEIFEIEMKIQKSKLKHRQNSSTVILYVVKVLTNHKSKLTHRKMFLHISLRQKKYQDEIETSNHQG